eukprot:Trichotokara_eunicae@DN6361_c1_g3_i2.p1
MVCNVQQRFLSSTQTAQLAESNAFWSKTPNIKTSNKQSILINWNLSQQSCLQAWQFMYLPQLFPSGTHGGELWRIAACHLVFYTSFLKAILELTRTFSAFLIEIFADKQ